jgi:hypothetical protein
MFTKLNIIVKIPVHFSKRLSIRWRQWATTVDKMAGSTQDAGGWGSPVWRKVKFRPANFSAEIQYQILRIFDK